MLGCVCASVGAPLAPRHSWLGCAPWVCVFGLGFRLRPATAGRGVGVCVCSCACSSCTPPLLAGMCGLGVCSWAPVSAAPRNSWLGCWAVCVLVCALCLHPATPGWAAGCGCVCLGPGFGCALPLLPGVLDCVCAPVRAPLARRHSWLECTVWVCVFGLGFRLRPTTPGWAVGVCVFVCLLPLYPASLGWGARRGCVRLGSGFGCAPPLLAGVLDCVCLCACPPCTPPLLAGVCGGGVCVFGLGFRLHPATPGWGVGLCVCWCGRSACNPPLLAGVHAVGVCVWARVSAAPRNSWLGCLAVCVLVLALRLHPATPGQAARRGCVCLGSGFGCAPPLLAGVLGCVCAGVGPQLAPRNSLLGCAVWVCVFGLGFRLHPATPGWDVGLCVCSCGRSACTPPLLAGLRAVGMCVWARVPAAPRHSWLRCWGVCVLVCVPPLYPATPGWCVRCGCVCLGWGFGCGPPLLAGVLECACAGVRAPPVPRLSWLGCAAWVCVIGLGFRLRPATPGWGVGLYVCSCARSACKLPLLAGMHDVGV